MIPDRIIHNTITLSLASDHIRDVFALRHALSIVACLLLSASLARSTRLPHSCGWDGCVGLGCKRANALHCQGDDDRQCPRIGGAIEMVLRWDRWYDVAVRSKWMNGQSEKGEGNPSGRHGGKRMGDTRSCKVDSLLRRRIED